MPVLDDWTADVDAMADAVGPRTVLVVGSAPQYPQGVVDPIPAIAEVAASVGANCHVDACMGGFVLPFAERLGPRRAAVGLPRRGRPLDLGRHPQARLRAQGRVGDPPPHEGAAPLPDVRVRRLARRLLRLAEPAGHAVGAPDGGGVGGDAAPRRRRLRRADAASRSTTPTGCGPASPPSTASGCSATARSTSSRWPPTGGDRSARRLRGRRRAARRGWFHDRQTPPDSLHSTSATRQRRRRSTTTSPTSPSASAEVRGHRRRRPFDHLRHPRVTDPGFAASEGFLRGSPHVTLRCRKPSDAEEAPSTHGRLATAARAASMVSSTSVAGSGSRRAGRRRARRTPRPSPSSAGPAVSP